jgi:hypothetical protein
LLFVTILTVFQNQVVYQNQMIPHMKNFAAGMNHLKPMAYWLRTNAPTEATVLASDAGLLGYVSEKYLYDTAGLITPSVRKSFEGVGYDEGMVQSRYAAAVWPDFIVDRASSRARLRSDVIQPIMSVDFPGLGLNKPDTVFYTLYRVSK